MDFIVYAANLHAFNYGLKGETDRDYFRRELENVIVPEFKPKEGVKIQVQENETVDQDSGNGKCIFLMCNYLFLCINCFNRFFGWSHQEPSRTLKPCWFPFDTCWIRERRW